jgi:hypothetical protein
MVTKSGKVTPAGKQALRNAVLLERQTQEELALKTGQMLKLEILHGQRIEDLLDGRQPGSVLAERLQVSEACISKWRKRLNIGLVQKQCQYCHSWNPGSVRTCKVCGSGMLRDFVKLKYKNRKAHD